MLENQAFLQEFASEAKCHSEKIELGLLEVEKGRQTREIIQDIFRSAHSIKGTAGFFGLQNIVDLAHAMESLLGILRSKTISMNQAIIDALLEANDELKELIQHIEQSNEKNIGSYIQKLRSVAEEEMNAPEQAKSQTAKKTMALENPSITEAVSNVSLDYLEHFKELIKKGHKVYKLLWPLNEDSVEADKTFSRVAENIRSIGGLMLTKRISQGLTEEQDTGLFIFSTILDKELVLIALCIDKEEIIELDIRQQAGEVVSLLQELKNTGPRTTNEEPKESPAETFKVLDEQRWQTTQEERVRVDVGVLNNLVNLSSEMILARNQLLCILADRMDEIPGLRPVLQKVDYTTTKLQENIMQTRMQPIDNLFNSAPRMVRELSKKLGKKVELYIDGQDVELDKSIIEGLKDPFAHIIRNAMDHGIETPDIRQATGKPPGGIVHLTAYNEGGRVVIDITDDGAGIDVAKVKQKAVEKGLITTERAAVAGEAELLKIIFLPGFSTNAKVDQVSGRGVGLDVVHANVEKMGGIVELFTNLQKGTTFRLILPLTLAIIPSILVETEKHRFALPQASLREIVRIVPGGAYQLSYIKEQCVLRLRGQLLPVVALAKAVGLPLSPLSQTATMRVLLLKRGNKSFGLLVDRITDREDILVKPIPSYLKAKTVYSGVTILGDGKIAMVLDPEGIAAAAHIAKAQEQLASEAALGQNPAKKKEASLSTILLFKAAGQETIGVELSKIKRVEEVVPQQMEYISGKPYYNFQGSILRLVRMEEYLPIETAAEKYTKQYVIILKDGPFPVGFIATKIENTVQTGLKIVHSAFNALGLADTVLVEDKIILLVNLSNFFARLKAQQRVLETESAKEHG